MKIANYELLTAKYQLKYSNWISPIGNCKLKVLTEKHQLQSANHKMIAT